ncbi:MAG: Undecaprenyl-phosphate mannosyltransferase [Bacillales bacterium]|jgi:glycosyltransferase involved in cell wall biosynthesis|nr:Undecaprenyl-phosphate mannosyltransferase [Bacillales bacterium]
MNKFLIVIPAYNEESNIEFVIHSLKNLKLPIDIIVINDGSNDDTLPNAKKCGVPVVTHPTNLGYLAAVQTGFKYAAKKEYPYIIYFDGDGQHDPIYIKDIMTEIEKDENDVVIGSRFLDSNCMKISKSKLMVVKMFRTIIYQITNKKITDPTSGFKAYKEKVYRRFIDSNNFNYDLPDSNFIIDILLQNYKIVEIPVNMFDRQHGKSKIHNTGIKPLIYLAQTLLSIFIVTMKSKLSQRGDFR